MHDRGLIEVYWGDLLCGLSLNKIISYILFNLTQHYECFRKWFWVEDRKCWCGPNRVNLNTLRPRQNGRHLPDDIFKYIFLNENVWISIKISLQFVSKGPINNIPSFR